MYFMMVNEIENDNRQLLQHFDAVLREMHSSSRLFTHVSISRRLQIPEELSFGLLCDARSLGIVDTVQARQCEDCLNIVRSMNDTLRCANCGGLKFRTGYYFTTDLHKNN